MNKKILFILIFLITCNFIFAQYEISTGEYDSENKTIEIILENEEDIGGFQFQLTGINLTGASGGTAEDANFSVNTSEIGVVLGFSFSGATIPAGLSTLTNITFDSINNQYTEITNLTISSPDGVTITNSSTSGIIDHGPAYCNGTWDTYAELDECGLCNGPGAIYECGCYNIPNDDCDCNNNILDDCGNCGGDGSSCYYSLSLDNFNITEQTVDVIISNPEPILGFQFNVTGLNMISANGGLAAENDFATNVGSDVVLGFSWSGSNIPSSNNQILTTINFDNVTNQETIIENIILSDMDANTISNVDGLGIIHHGESNCAGDYYSYDDTNIHGCCFEEIPDCLGDCNGFATTDECGVCNGDGYSCLDCFEFDEFDCTTSPFCDWETDSINCSNFSSSSQCNAVDGCDWVSGGGGGGGYGSGEHDEDEQNSGSNTRGFCDGGIIEIDAFCIDTPCDELNQSNCSLLSECQWLNSNTLINCMNLPEEYCNEAFECTWLTGDETDYYGDSGHCSGGSTLIENNTCADFIIPGCMIDIATNFNPDANTDDGSCIFPPLGVLNFEELDIWTGTLEIHLDCEYPVSEFVIDISGLNMTGCFGGASEVAGFDMFMDNNTITGISTGQYIPEHSGLLMVLTFDDIVNGNICYENSWITTSANIEYEAILGECILDIDNCGIPGGSGSNGDVNENGSVDIGDITYIIEHIIGESFFTNDLTCIGDINMNGILNITDVVMLIELILYN